MKNKAALWVITLAVFVIQLLRGFEIIPAREGDIPGGAIPAAGPVLFSAVLAAAIAYGIVCALAWLYRNIKQKTK